MNRSSSVFSSLAGYGIERWEPPEIGSPVRKIPESARGPPSPPPPPPPVAEVKPLDEVIVPPPRLPTAAEVEAIEAAAREAGFAAGYEEGRALGYAEAEKEMRARQEKKLRETVEALEGVARDLADPLASAIDSLEPELLTLVATLAQRVIMAELSVRTDLIQRVLQQALEQLPSRHHAVRVYVHPDDCAILQAYATARGDAITWLPDPGITRGGCRVESGPSRIDATLEVRLRQAVDAIWGELAPPAGAGGEAWPSDPEEESP